MTVTAKEPSSITWSSSSWVGAGTVMPPSPWRAATGRWREVATAGTAEQDGAPLWPDTPFYYYTSVTKLYTATAVMQLWERGRLDLDAAISAYLPPEHTGGLHRLGGVDRSAAITVRHLLSHTSGLPDYFLDTLRQTSFADRIEQATSYRVPGR